MPSMQFGGTSAVEESSIAITVIRCGCGNPSEVHPGEPCPRPRAVEDEGIVSYYHRNPLRRALWRLRRFMHG